MSRLLPMLLVLLYGLLVLNAASGMADTADCHGGDHTHVLAQASSECQTDRHILPCHAECGSPVLPLPAWRHRQWTDHRISTSSQTNFCLDGLNSNSPRLDRSTAGRATAHPRLSLLQSTLPSSREDSAASPQNRMTCIINRRTLLTGAACATTLGLAGYPAHWALASEGRRLDSHQSHHRGQWQGGQGLWPDRTGWRTWPSFDAGGMFDVLLDNQLADPTMIHWHGLTPPVEFDGVPDMPMSLLKAGEQRAYRFPVGDGGTHWMHAHTLQEQNLLAAPLSCEPPRIEPRTNRTS